MAGLFNLAADRALHMSQPPPPKISIAIGIGQPLMGMAGGGGLSSVQKRMNIGGQPHKLAYINSDEASLLKQLGGLGEPVEGTRGVPAYIGVTDQSAESYDADVGGWGEDDSVDEGGGYSAAVKEGMTPEEADQAQQTAALEEEALSQGTAGTFGSGIGWMGFGTTGGTPDWRGKTWGVQDPETGKSLQDKGLADSFKDMGWMDYLGAMLNPQGAALGVAGKGLMAAYEGIKGNLADKAALQDIIDNPLTSVAAKNQAQEALDKHDKGYFDPDDPHDSPTEEAETKIKKVLDIGEEEEEEGRWDKYYEDREDRDPYEGYEYILEDVYGPDWRDRLKEGII